MSEINPDVVVTRRMLSGRSSDEAAPASPAGGEPRKEREGLPASYRMRADPHYVDLLGANGERGERPAPPPEIVKRNRRATDTTASVSEVRSGHDFQDERAERLIAEIGDDLATIASATALLSSDASPMARRVALDLIRSETWRASWAVRAHTLLRNPDRARLAPCDLGALLADVREAFAAECRLSGTAFVIAVPAWGTTVPADHAALLVGTAGAVVWALGKGVAGEGAVVSARVEITDGRLALLEVSHTSAEGVAPQRRLRREPATSDEWAAELGAAAARTAARLHGAEATFLAGDGQVSTVRFTFR